MELVLDLLSLITELSMTNCHLHIRNDRLLDRERDGQQND
jgi:hypothetical protein